MFSFIWILAYVVIGSQLCANAVPTTVNDTPFTDPLIDLKRHIAKSLVADLEPRIDAALKANGEWPDASENMRPYRLSLFLRMGQELPENNSSAESDVTVSPNEFSSSRFIAAIDARITLFFRPKDPTLDMRLKKILTDYFNERGSVQSLTLQPNKPLLRLDITIKPSRQNFADGVRRNIVLLVIAVLVFMFLSQLDGRRYKRTARPLGSRVNQSPSARTPAIFPPPLAVEAPTISLQNQPHLESRPHIRPTAGYEFLQEKLRADTYWGVKEGSWYLYSLPEISTAELQAAFQKMPFDQAITILRLLSSHYKMDIASRLELVPALMRDSKRPINASTAMSELLKPKEFRQNSTVVDKKRREHQAHDSHEFH